MTSYNHRPWRGRAHTLFRKGEQTQRWEDGPRMWLQGQTQGLRGHGGVFLTQHLLWGPSTGRMVSQGCGQGGRAAAWVSLLQVNSSLAGWSKPWTTAGTPSASAATCARRSWPTSVSSRTPGGTSRALVPSGQVGGWAGWCHRVTCASRSCTCTVAWPGLWGTPWHCPASGMAARGIF